MLYRIINALDEFPDFTTEAEHPEAGCANSVLRCSNHLISSIHRSTG